MVCWRFSTGLSVLGILAFATLPPLSGGEYAQAAPPKTFLYATFPSSSGQIKGVMTLLRGQFASLEECLAEKKKQEDDPRWKSAKFECTSEDKGITQFKGSTEAPAQKQQPSAQKPAPPSGKSPCDIISTPEQRAKWRALGQHQYVNGIDCSQVK